MPKKNRTKTDEGILARDLAAFFDKMSAHFPGHVMQRVLEPDGRVRYTYVSPGLTALGLDPEAIIAADASPQDWIHPDDAPRWRVALRMSAETLETLDEEVRVIGGDGRVRWIRSIGNPRRLASGATVWDGIALDETDKREALDALRLAKAQADAAEAAKARALSGAAAEIRGPLDEIRARARVDASLDAVVADLERALLLLTDREVQEALRDDADRAGDPRLAALTDRQRAVLALVGGGLSNRDIGVRLGISEGTVKLHVAAILKALGVGNRTEAALIGAGSTATGH
jgi:DNA-binding NarL/FixJ family response regulator